MKKKTSMKKGITLIEIILAIVLIAIILGITIPKLMANSARAEIKAVISSDVKSIVEAAALWRKSNRVANGSYATVDNEAISTRLPSTMETDGTNTGAIESSGLRTGSGIDGQNTGVRYYITWTLSPVVATTASAQGTPTTAFSLVMDTTSGIELLNWDDRLREYANEIFQNTISELTLPSTITAAPGSNDYTTDVSAGTATGYTPTAPAFTCNTRDFQCSDLVLVNQ